MTNEEAIEKLELMRQKVDEETYRALILAIKALSQEPCDDAISRDAVYSILKEYHIDEEEIESAMDDCQNLTVNSIASDVSLLPPVTQKSGKWIPFSERLPKPFEHCLITTTDGEVIYHYDDGHYSKYKAWMPLPEPYKVENEYGVCKDCYYNDGKAHAECVLCDKVGSEE